MRFVLSAALAAFAATVPLSNVPALAATAHNAQAGAYGPSKNACAPTAYFPGDSECLGSFFDPRPAGEALPPPYAVRDRYRPRPPLQ